MGAITDFSAFKSYIEHGTDFFVGTGNINASGYTSTTQLNVFLSGFGQGQGGATPTTPTTCDSSTVGALLTAPRLSSVTNDLWLVQAEIGQTGAQFGFMLIDRLSHQGGLSGIVAGAQTTNLPTAALTRYTDGVGVCIGLESYSAMGGTATTITASYTNQSGVSGQTTKAVASNSTGAAFQILPLADGDTGVRSVESVTFAATTGTAGNIGVTLFKPIAFIPRTMSYTDTPYWSGLAAGKMIKVDSGACLSVLCKSNSVHVYNGTITLAEA